MLFTQLQTISYNQIFKTHINQGRMQDFSGGGPNFKISVISDILRAFARGVWGHAPPKNFYKWCNFVCFEGYFQPLSW